MAVGVHGIDFGSGGVALKAAGLVAADTAETGVFLGRGWHVINLVWTACEAATNDEFYNVQFQANTVAAATTWLDLPNVALGDTTLLGDAAETAATGDMAFAIFNPYDHQVRVNTWVTGTIATGMNFAVTAYPINIVGAF